MKRLVHKNFQEFFQTNEFVAKNSPMRTHYFSKNLLEKMLWQQKLTSMKSILRSIEYSNVLDIGCGDGVGIQTVDNTANYTGLDISPTQIAYMEKHLPTWKNNRTGSMTLILHDAVPLPFKSSSFDLILACDVLEHVLEPEKLLQEIRRVLKPRGFLFISIPNEPIWEVLRTLMFRFPARSPDHISYIQESDISHVFPTILYKKRIPNIFKSLHLISLMLVQ
jgi:ubiquinone/menaquinone biosynthesis C-methylase UbiE